MPEAKPEPMSSRETFASPFGNSRGEPEILRRQLRLIAALADAGSHDEARGACADLLFDSQPLLVAHPALAAQFEDVLLRCGATALHARFLLATKGDAPMPRIVPPPKKLKIWTGLQAPRQVAAWAKQKV
jgi:hypothetical protein